MTDNSIYWYDFETFGSDPRKDRASQFAGVRTDEDLNIIGDPLVMYCQPADDFLPNPMACAITGISPQKALQEGLCEAEFISKILREFAEPGTCVAGYNSIRFDDEVTRQLLYRNFYDPYEREWKNGNSRWDIIDMVRLCAATRPEGINWPLKEDGSKSFRLDQLTVANDIEHGSAHDALADVIATIELAKLVKTKQAKLFDYVYKLRNKRKVQAEIDIVSQKPLLHVSMMYPSRLGCLALVMPLCAHPTNSNGIIVYDLRTDPSALLNLTTEEIRTRVFTATALLEEGQSRIPLKTIHTNKCPIVTSAAVLEPEKALEYEIDLPTCKKHWQMLQGNNELIAKLGKVFSEEYEGGETDPDRMIYTGGFFGEGDKSLMQTIRATAPEDLGRLDMPFKDGRLKEMLFRYRARNYKHTLAEDELRDWEDYRKLRISTDEERDGYQQGLTEAKQRGFDLDSPVLVQLSSYVEGLL